MATKKTAENAGSGQGEATAEGFDKAPGEAAATPPAEPGKDAPPSGGEVKADAPAPERAAPKDETIPEQIERCAGELKSCDPRPTAEEMFGRFMVSVASRPLSVHQPVNEIADTAERLTAAWLERKDKFAGK